MPGRRRYEAIDSPSARFWLTPSRRPPDKRPSHTRTVVNTTIHNWTGLAVEFQRRFCLNKSGEVLRGGRAMCGLGRAGQHLLGRRAWPQRCPRSQPVGSILSVAICSAGICTRRRESELNSPMVRFPLTRLHVQHRSHASPFSTSMPHFTAVQGGSD